MWTSPPPPGRSGTLARWAVVVPASAGPLAAAAAGTQDAAAAASGPWLLAAVVLVLGVVIALAGALGYLWGRQSLARADPLAAPALTVRPAALQAAEAALSSPHGEAAPQLPTVPLSPAPQAPHAPPTDEGLSFSYTVSHDLRAPVRVVDGFARILKEDYGRQLDRIGNDHLDRILSAAARMNAMIDAMLSLAQLTTRPLARQPVNLSQLAGFVLDDLQRNQPERAVQVDIEPDLQVMGDPTLMRLVLENLLSNAWKYTSRTGAPCIRLSATVQNGQRVFEVKDNGAGFDMRSSDRLFGLFQRLHSANDFPGTGVGLASVQRIVRRHGGEIWAESAPGQGARFCFTVKD